ncbi:MAG: hypothetical protein HQL50_12315 [Magnetococcales bacterium]|nr:hypothetical protein [Magnetococcales bacterium]
MSVEAARICAGTDAVESYRLSVTVPFPLSGIPEPELFFDGFHLPSGRDLPKVLESLSGHPFAVARSSIQENFSGSVNHRRRRESTR